MSCPFFIEGTRNLCGAFKGLFHPSLYEQEQFCKTDQFPACGIFQHFETTDRKVTQREYLEKIYARQFQHQFTES